MLGDIFSEEIELVPLGMTVLLFFCRLNLEGNYKLLWDSEVQDFCVWPEVGFWHWSKGLVPGVIVLFDPQNPI